jgi:AraC-like DNA-binding protein
LPEDDRRGLGMADFSIPTDKAIAEKSRSLITADLSRPYSVPELAAACGVMPYTLKRIFKKMYGQSIASFYLQVRMDRAKELLTTTNNTMQMIADAVGYTEGNNFQRVFKNVTGMTPGEWRRRYQ